MRPSERRDRLARSRLYLVCDGKREDLPELLEESLAAGVDIVQLRDKEAEAGALLRAGEVFAEAAGRHDALFVVNDRPDVALALGADGVHLGQGDLPVVVARRILGSDVLIGLSTHSPRQIEAADWAADYLSAGPVWETPTKPGRPAAGLDLIRHAAATVRRPWFAIGGITPENVGEVVGAGAGRIAVVRALTDADSPAEAVRDLLALLPE